MAITGSRRTASAAEGRKRREEAPVLLARPDRDPEPGGVAIGAHRPGDDALPEQRLERRLRVPGGLDQEEVRDRGRERHAAPAQLSGQERDLAAGVPPRAPLVLAG